MRSTRMIGALATTAAVVAGALAASAPAPAATYIECQHPVMTGVEVSRLSHVSTATACRVALSLFRWENSDDHISKLYRCVGRPPRTPVLKLHSFDGWSLSIAKSGFFEMSRGEGSFYVTGTDFPLNCT